MKVCILSDSHDHIPLLDEAAARAKRLGAEAILHCGDVVAPSTLKCLNKHQLPVHVIHGNNTGDLYNLGQLVARSDNLFEYHGMDVGVELGGRRIFMVHYPHYAEAMAATGDWDLVCCGHTHQTRLERVTNIKGTTTVLLNPGTVGGVGSDPSTFAIGDLETMEFEFHELPKQIEQPLSELAVS